MPTHPRDEPPSPRGDYLQREIEGSDAIALEIAARYEKRFSVRWIYARQSDFILRFLKDQGVRELVELGCGMGNFLVEAVGGFDRVIGVDPAPESLEIARRLVPEAELREGRGEQLPFEDDEVEAVLMKGVVHHVEDPVRVFKEVARSLRPGGIILTHRGSPPPAATTGR